MEIRIHQRRIMLPELIHVLRTSIINYAYRKNEYILSIVRERTPTEAFQGVFLIAALFPSRWQVFFEFLKEL